MIYKDCKSVTKFYKNGNIMEVIIFNNYFHLQLCEYNDIEK